jgi:predicted acetyltransferase
MPSIQIYNSNKALPLAIEHQIRAYVRILWHDAYTYDLNAPLVPDERHPQYVVLGEQHALFSAARVNWVTVSYVGQSLKMYCIGDVFTYPAFRKQGYANQVVDAATRLIRSDASTDAAILFTDPALENLYGQSGWQHVSELQASIGLEDSPEAYPAFAMMLFLSEKGLAAKANFARHPIFLPGYGW